MQKFQTITAVAAPLLRSNIDTDAITPGDRLLHVKKSGFAEALFANWRLLYDEDGSSRENPDFVLNQAPYDKARILLAGPNFACGSSRETAVWALRDWGIRAVIAPSFGGIFLANCFKNGLLPVVLPFDEVRSIAEQVTGSAGQGQVTVDLERGIVRAPDGSEHRFEINDYQRQVLLQGLDPISAALLYEKNIDDFQRLDREKRPWIYSNPAAGPSAP